MNKFKRTDFSGSKEAEGKKVTKCIKIELTSENFWFHSSSKLNILNLGFPELEQKKGSNKPI